MKILVTGATGFLGRSVTRRLAEAHDLTLLVRRTSSREGFPPNVRFAEGDVTDRASLVRAAEGCEAIVHGAALVKLVAPGEAFDRVNVGGLENVLAAAAETGVTKIVHVSSFIALGPSDEAPGRILDESAPARDRDWINHYERTKTRADQRARAAIEAGVPLVVVYPGVIYGPGVLTEGNLVVRGLAEALNRKLPALVGEPGRLWSYVHVEDVAAGIEAAVERGEPGRRYVLAGENVTLGDFYATAEAISGVPMPGRWMPRALAKGLGAGLKAFACLLGRDPKLTPDMVEVCHHDWGYSSAAAERDLGYRPRPLREGLAETIAWMEETGLWAR